ncbi:vef [Euproctis pseudoconspersa nucleopolyhedrovirus]|uniref:Vef n=1 Tax=Euproctis pseudoconspersa nucleopolyhedrovirus TaxID=307467 RepID=C3TWT0_9ABAC|nr:vef [Euproctis pseudoconspersa nucleopolyhedrovirus]ACO53472.1 vef [Euproctis pseudoconspersa nucleopolyhedrovirus]
MYNMSVVRFSLKVEPTILPKWLHKSDRFYALHHRRVCLNYLCNINTTIEIQLKNYPRVSAVVMRCLNSNEIFETTLNIDSGEPFIFTFPQTYVPYIDNVVGDLVAAELDVTITNYRSVLPVYKHSVTDAEEFLTNWNDTSTFAHIELDHIVFLTPRVDRPLLNFTLFTKLNDFYNNMLAFYDNMIGITDTVTDPSINSLSDNYNYTNYKKIFCKADFNGSGIAYYGTFWIAHSSYSISEYLKADPTNWLALHEVGHAYDFNFVTNVPVLSEVWTNVLPDRYQFYNMTYEERQRLSWIFGEGNRQTVEKSLQSLISSKTKYSSDDYYFRERLLTLGLMMNTSFAETAFKLINKLFRQNRSNDNYYFIMDWLASLSQDDFLPFIMLMQIFVVSKYMQLAQLNIKDYFTFEQSAAKFKRVAYPVCRLIDDFDVSTNNYGIRLESNFSLIYPYQINIVSRIAVDIIIDSFSQIVNEPFLVYDGARLVHHQSITSNRMIFDLPVGVYTVRVPLGKLIRHRCRFIENDYPDEGNDCTNLYLFVKNQDRVNVRLVYTPISKPRVQTHRVGYVLGLGDRFSIKFVVNLLAKSIEITAYRNSIHHYFDRYFAVQLYNNTDMSLLSEAIVHGIQTDNYYQILHYNVNNRMRIILYDNATRNRFIFMDTKLERLSNDYLLIDDDIIDINNSLTINMETQTRNRLVEHIAFVDNHFTLFYFDSVVKEEIYLMIQTLPDRQTLMAKYNRYLPKYIQQQHIAQENVVSEDRSKFVGAVVVIVMVIIVIMFLLFKLVYSKTTNITESTPLMLDRQQT